MKEAVRAAEHHESLTHLMARERALSQQGFICTGDIEATTRMCLSDQEKAIALGKFWDENLRYLLKIVSKKMSPNSAQWFDYGNMVSDWTETVLREGKRLRFAPEPEQVAQFLSAVLEITEAKLRNLVEHAYNSDTNDIQDFTRNYLNQLQRVCTVMLAYSQNANATQATMTAKYFLETTAPQALQQIQRDILFNTARKKSTEFIRFFLSSKIGLDCYPPSQIKASLQEVLQAISKAKAAGLQVSQLRDKVELVLGRTIEEKIEDLGHQTPADDEPGTKATHIL